MLNHYMLVVDWKKGFHHLGTMTKFLLFRYLSSASLLSDVGSAVAKNFGGKKRATKAGKNPQLNLTDKCYEFLKKTFFVFT